MQTLIILLVIIVAGVYFIGQNKYTAKKLGRLLLIIIGLIIILIVFLAN